MHAAVAPLLIYHRIGKCTADELDLEAAAFDAEVALLAEQRLLFLDAALDVLDRGSR